MKLKMKIAHEAPLSMMESVRFFTDYDYALGHLFDEYPEYYQYFEDSLKIGRTVILDNGLYELGKPMISSEYAEQILKLQPTEYIVPDYFDETDRTIEEFENWEKDFKDLPGKKIGVVQGESWKEMHNCYHFMAEHADKIAINFTSPYFKSFVSSEAHWWNASEWERVAEGRLRFVEKLLNDNIFKYGKPHHLLGCTVPNEFMNYTNIPIDTIDTSNPVIYGIEKGKYEIIEKDDELMRILVEDKFSKKVADILKQPVDIFQKESIIHNIKTFRRLVQ